MRENFERAVELTLPFEGGYSNHPRDPGGPTMKGVTLATFSQYLGRQATIAELKAITDDQIRGVAHLFWDPLKCDDLPAGVDYAVFDRGWGSGPRTSARALQKIVGVATDGRIGPITLAAVAAWEPHALIREIARTYLLFMQSLDTWDVFGDGWTWRVNGVRGHALEMADGVASVPRPSPQPQQQVAPTPMAKAFPTRAAVAAGVLVLIVVLFRKPLWSFARWSKRWFVSGNRWKQAAAAGSWLTLAGVSAFIIGSLL